MIYYIFVVLSVFFYRIKIDHSDPNSKYNKIYFSVAALLLFLIAALRNSVVGYDAANYFFNIRHIYDMSWHKVFELHSDEPGFYVLAKFISQFTADPQVVLGAVGLIFAVSICLFIKRYSDAPDLSFCILIAFSFFAFSLSGLRQTLAISIVIISVIFAEKRKLIPFALCIALAYCFHNSALFACLIYFMFIKNGNFARRIIFLICIPIVTVFRRPLLNYGLSKFYSDYTPYDNEVGSYMTLLLYLLIWVVYIIFMDKDLQKETKYIGFENMMMMGILLQIFVPIEPNIFRLAMYYQISSLIILPSAVKKSKAFDRNTKIVVYLCCIAVLTVMYFKFTYSDAGANPYFFFWEKAGVL